ncbi:MAG: hypothetical protein ACK56I_28335, partial [bacterium]
AGVSAMRGAGLKAARRDVADEDRDPRKSGRRHEVGIAARGQLVLVRGVHRGAQRTPHRLQGAVAPPLRGAAGQAADRQAAGGHQQRAAAPHAPAPPPPGGVE